MLNRRIHHTHTCKHTYTYIHVHAHAHTHTLTNTQPYKTSHTNTHTQPCKTSHTHTHTQPYKTSHAHTHTHTHTHTTMQNITHSTNSTLYLPYHYTELTRRSCQGGWSLWPSYQSIHQSPLVGMHSCHSFSESGKTFHSTSTVTDPLLIAPLSSPPPSFSSSPFSHLP